MSYLKVSSYQDKWNIEKSRGALSIQTQDGVSYSTKELRTSSYLGILEDFNYADKIQYDPKTTQHITIKNY